MAPALRMIWSPSTVNVLTAALDQNAGSPIPLKQQLVHGAVGADREVQAVPGRFQITEGGAEADPVMVVGNTGSDTGGVRAVVVRAIRKSGSPAGVIKSSLRRLPVFPPGVVNEDRAVGAMKVVVVVHIGLNFPEVGQDLPETPAVVAQSGPVVVVFGNPTKESRCVNRAGAAGNLAPGHRHVRKHFSGAPNVLPVVTAIQQGYRVTARCAQSGSVPAGVVSELDIIGKVLKLRIVRSGLQQQHRYTWVPPKSGLPGCCRRSRRQR